MNNWEPKIGEPCEVMVCATGKWIPGVIKEVWINPTIRIGSGNLNRLNGRMYVVKTEYKGERPADCWFEMIPEFVRPAKKPAKKKP